MPESLYVFFISCQDDPVFDQILLVWSNFCRIKHTLWLWLRTYFEPGIVFNGWLAGGQLTGELQTYH
jgi:hypothetical protein